MPIVENQNELLWQFRGYKVSEDIPLDKLYNIYKKKLYKDEKERGHDPTDANVQSRVNKIISRLKQEPKKLPAIREELNEIYNQGQET